ncbi:Uncharacterised protein [Bordetella pertussis]|nr:Uncharacterised protein [Bordetella pertussis]
MGAKPRPEPLPTEAVQAVRTDMPGAYCVSSAGL